MVTFQDKDGRYQLPTGWHEVSTKQYCELDRAGFYTVEQRASFFAGRPIQVNALVADALAWALRQPSTEGSAVTYPADLGQESFLQVESIRELLTAQPLNECFAQVFGIFRARHIALLSPEVYNPELAAKLAERALDWPITDTYPAVAHCLAELKRLDESFAALGEEDITEAGRRAREAGSERLAVFKHFNVARHYAERFSTTPDAIYQWSYQNVMLLLLQDKLTAEINDKMMRQTLD